MLGFVKRATKGLFDRMGYSIVKKAADTVPDHAWLGMDAEFLPPYELCKPYTMTSIEKMYGLWKAAEYVCKAGVQGAFVESGVARAGSSMMAAHAFQHFGDSTRPFFLYDTYKGMTAPTEDDRDFTGESAKPRFDEMQREGHNDWCYGPLEEVQANMATTGFPADNITYVQGPVEETLPGTRPDAISLLRLDTDWYASTAHELKHLYPRLVPGGVLIVDDYGQWEGCKRAVDEFLVENPLLLVRLDRLGIMGVKPSA